MPIQRHSALRLDQIVEKAFFIAVAVAAQACSIGIARSAALKGSCLDGAVIADLHQCIQKLLHRDHAGRGRQLAFSILIFGSRVRPAGASFKSMVITSAPRRVRRSLSVSSAFKPSASCRVEHPDSRSPIAAINSFISLSV